jgi:CheY-like chemotaxis protein
MIAPLGAGTRNGAVTRVLIAEDHRDVATSLQRLLQLFGFDVAAVTNGTDAVAAAIDFAPNAALIDLTLPGLDGCEVAAALRGLPTTRDCRLIAMTGWTSDESRERTKAAGFDAHLVKPITATRLVDAIVGSSANTDEPTREATFPVTFAVGSHAQARDREPVRRHAGDVHGSNTGGTRTRSTADVHTAAVLGDIRKV